MADLIEEFVEFINTDTSDEINDRSENHQAIFKITRNVR
jgi:hypothetical protein